MSLQIYIISALEILLPIAALLVLMRVHKYRLAAVIGGIAAYYLSSEILLSIVTMMLSAVGFNQLYWSMHETAGSVLNVILNSLFHNICLYIILRFTLKNRGRVYDAMALGISYWVFSSVLNAISNAYYARILQLHDLNRLSEMVNESVSLEQLQLTASDIIAAGTSNYYAQLLALLGMSAVSAALCLFFYLSVKRKTGKYFLLGSSIHIVAMILINLPIFFGNTTLYIVTNVIALSAGLIVIWRFMVWYRAKQKALAYRKKHYQDEQVSEA